MDGNDASSREPGDPGGGAPGSDDEEDTEGGSSDARSAPSATANRGDARSTDAIDADGPSARPAEETSFEWADDPDVTGPPEEIDPEALTVPLRSLHPRVRYLWILKRTVSAVVIGAIVAVLDTFVLAVGPALPVGIATVAFALGVAHALLQYRIWRYEVREDALYLERGVVTRVRTVVPFVRIQHVDTSRSPLERATGLASSVVYTAGSRGADVTIPGLTPDRAEDMQRRLKRLAIAAENDTAV